MTRRDPASEVPDLGDGFWERVAAATRGLQSAGMSLWNGRLNYVGDGVPVDGSADGRGTVRLSRSAVVEPLTRMFAEGPGSLRESVFAARCWIAAQTAVHEFSHLTAPGGWTAAQRSRDLWRADLEPIEEAFTEAYSRTVTPEVIDRVLAPDLARGLASVPRDHPDLLQPAYPGWTAAAMSFANDVSAETGLSRDEVLRVAAREPDSRKAAALATLLYAHSRLPGAVPELVRSRVKQAISDAINDGFAQLGPLEWNQSTVPWTRGSEIADTALNVIRAAERQYAEPVDLPRAVASRGRRHAGFDAADLAIGHAALNGMAHAAAAPLVPKDQASQVRQRDGASTWRDDRRSSPGGRSSPR